MRTTLTTPASSTEGDPRNQDANSKARLLSKASRQRFKPQLSCTLCRARKQKCDRELPCSNCIKRDLSSSCTYIHAGLQGKISSTHVSPIHPSTGSPIHKRKEVQSRVRHLEELVVSLMHQSALKNPPPRCPEQTSGRDVERMKAKSIVERLTERCDLGETSDSFGRVSIEDEQLNYVGAAHWAAILDSITDLKESLDDNKRTQEPEETAIPAAKEPELLVGTIPKATKAEVLAALPPRSVVDVLVVRFYRTSEFSPSIHIPTFKREYENFWADPGSTPVMWIGLLYAMMCISLNVELLYEGRASSLDGQALRDPHEAIIIFREKTVQCLVLGNYTEPTQYTVETLLLYFFTEHFRSSESHVGAWMAAGILVRAAMRLGYHRDARHSPTISVMRGEMQRRIWATVAHMDLQTSCRVGLPRMVKEGMFDTGPPRNLLDEDFDENTKALPPSRPFNEVTTIMYPLIKHGITRVYGMIVDQTSAIDPVSYDGIMKLDALLNDAHQQVPNFLKVRGVDDLKIGSPEIIVRKFSVDLCYQRARCVLHRKYLVPSKLSNPSQHWYSVKACVDAAMRMLQAQSYIFEESKPNMILYNHKWKTSSLMAHDFLLAAMLICVYLNQSVVNLSSEAGVNGIPIRWTRKEMLNVLDGSYRIWDEASRSSKDALKAAKALKRTLSRVRGVELVTRTSHHSPTTQSTGRSHRLPFSKRFPATMPESSNSSEVAGETSPWMSSFANPGPWYPAEHDTFQPPLAVVEDIVDAPIDLDWELWDNHFHNNLAGSLPDLWNFDPGNFAFPDNNENLME